MTTPPQGPGGPEYGQQPQSVYTPPDEGTQGAPAKGGTSRGLVIGGIGLGAALILGGGAYAVVNGLSGGGEQPADVLPGDSVMYARLDIDPSAGQKIAATRFMDQLPQEARDVLESQDWRAEVFTMLESSGELEGVDISYEEDIEPWLGDRVGMSVGPGPDGPEGEPLVAVAVQVNDQAAAESFFGELPEGEVDHYFDGDYAVFTAPEMGDDVQAAAESGTLADNGDFSGDMDAMGDPGIMSMWVDVAALAEVVPFDQLSGMAMSGLDPMSGEDDMTGDMPPASPFGDPAEALEQSGRVAMTLRFESDYAELHGIARGGESGIEPADATNIATTFPADTMAVLGFSGGETSVGQLYELLQQADPDMLAQAETELSQLGMTLPEDLQVLLGRSFGVGVDASVLDSLSGMADTADLPVGIKVDTSDTARFEELVDQLSTMAAGEGVPEVLTQVDGDVVSVALSEGYLGALTGGETLADDADFNLAVNNAEDAQMVFYLDVSDLAPLAEQSGDQEAAGFVSAIGGMGFSVTQTSESEGEFTLRVTAAQD